MTDSLERKITSERLQNVCCSPSVVYNPF